MKGYIEIQLKALKVRLSDLWIDKESYNEIGHEGLVELLMEDQLTFMEELGGLSNIIESSKWMELS